MTTRTAIIIIIYLLISCLQYLICRKWSGSTANQEPRNVKNQTAENHEIKHQTIKGREREEKSLFQADYRVWKMSCVSPSESKAAPRKKRVSAHFEHSSLVFCNILNLTNAQCTVIVATKTADTAYCLQNRLSASTGHWTPDSASTVLLALGSR